MYINRKVQNEQRQTKYKQESNITKWRQVIQMNKTMNRWLIEGVSSGVETRTVTPPLFSSGGPFHKYQTVPYVYPSPFQQCLKVSLGVLQPLFGYFEKVWETDGNNILRKREVYIPLWDCMGAWETKWTRWLEYSGLNPGDCPASGPVLRSVRWSSFWKLQQLLAFLTCSLCFCVVFQHKRLISKHS